jgi:putative Holliday junction resolvase
MARFIAFDYGSRRIGIAVTDSGALIASPECTCSPQECAEVLARLVQAEPCAGFVVGQPGLISGEHTHSTDDIAAFAGDLRKRHPEIPVHFVDEDHTSVEASMAMVTGGMRKSKRREKGRIDRIAAAIILQRFLDERG